MSKVDFNASLLKKKCLKKNNGGKIRKFAKINSEMPLKTFHIYVKMTKISTVNSFLTAFTIWDVLTVEG